MLLSVIADENGDDTQKYINMSLGVDIFVFVLLCFDIFQF